MLNGTLALWYESNERPVDGHEPCLELHFNLWRELPGSESDALDVGFRIKERHAIEKLCLFFPVKILPDDIEDLSNRLKDDRTLSAVFNETLIVDDFDDSVFAAVNPYNSRVSFHVIAFNKLSDINFIELKDCADSTGTIVQFRKSLFDRMQHVGDYYLRFRLKLAGGLKQLFVSSFSPKDKMFVSAFYTTDIIEFRLNERRNFPSSLLKSASQMKWPDVCAIYFILVRDFKAELIRAHTDFHKMRRLENNLWSDYVSSLTNEPPEHMFLYHWRTRKTSEPIDDFIALASFRTIRHSLIDYVLVILFLGMTGNALEAFLAAIFNWIKLGEESFDWSHFAAGVVCFSGALIVFYRDKLKEFFRG
jgi:hypothetical protein